MSGALNSVFGGGNILGAALNIASMCFPPLGIATAAASLVGQVVGQAVNQLAQQLTQQCGMPKFLQDVIGDIVKNALKDICPQSDPECREAVQDHCGHELSDLRDKLLQSMLENVKQGLESGDDETKAGKGGKGGGGGGWLLAIAKAMGSSAGRHAAEMVNLSNKLDQLTQKSGNKDQDAANAQEATIVQTKFQAESQMFSMLQNTFSNAIKSIGEGMSTMGRKG